MISWKMVKIYWAIQYTDRPAGTVKPIHRDIRGIMIIMVRLVLAMVSSCA